MNELKIESKKKFVGGPIIIYERENLCKMPPKGSIEVKAPENNKDFITMPLMPNPNIEKINSAMEL